MHYKTVLISTCATLGLLFGNVATAEDAATKATEESESAAALEAESFAESESSTQEAETKAAIEKDTGEVGEKPDQHP